jgi:hypothetical protein
MSNQKKRRKPAPRARKRLSVSRSPSTGDLGFTDHPWIRLNNSAVGIPHPVVMFDIDELRNSGYDPVRLGMDRIGDHHSQFEIPVVAVAADMKSRYDIDLYEAGERDMNDPKRIIGGVFDEPHPDDWWERVHRKKDLVIVAGDTPSFAAAAEANTPIDFGRIWVESYIGHINGLTIRAYASGVGTKMPGA